MLNIKVILGSTRDGRWGDKPAQWILDELKKREDITAELLDLRDYPMPFFNEAKTPSSIKEPYAEPMVQKWTAKIAEADAFIVVSPEYNHSYPAVLKNAFDYVYKDWNRKAVGFVSYGTVGGARAIEHLRGVVAELQMVSTRATVHISTPWLLPVENGVLKADALDPFLGSAKNMIDQVIWWGNALKAARV